MIGVEITVGQWLLVVLAGALLGLDAVSWPQAMASRPLVAGTLGGLLFGAPAAGFLAGAWLELVTSRHPPFGAARYPETGPAALIAGAAYALSASSTISGLVAATLAGWTIGWIGMHSIAALRSYNARLVADPRAFAGQPAEVARRHRRAIRMDAARAALLTGVLFVPAALGVRLLGSLDPGPLGTAWSPALAIAGLAGVAGIGARTLGSRRRRWVPFAVGAGAGLLVAWLVP